MGKATPIVLAVLLVLTGCAGNVKEESQHDEPTLSGSPERSLQPEALSADDDEKMLPELFRGNDRQVRMPATRPAVEFRGEDVSLNFEQAPLGEVVHVIMGDILDLDYILEHSISGEITLRTRAPIPRDELLPILESLLKANGATLVREGEHRYLISSSGDMPFLHPRFESYARGGTGHANIIVPLNYIGAHAMADVLMPVAKEEAFLRVDPVRNLLVLSGTRSQIDGWMEIINIFDVDILQGMSVGIFPLQYSTVEEVDAALLALLNGSGGGDGSGLDGLSGMIRIVPLERLGSILVITPRSRYLDVVKEWIERLDRSPDHNFESQLFVYPVQNGSASHIARLLGSIFGGGTTAGTRARDDGVEPGAGVARATTGRDTRRTGTRAGGGTTGGGGGGTTTGYTLDGDIRVIADEENNALLIYATRREYRKIEAALQRLDIMPAQVLIEASILEVTLTDELSYGLQWYLDNNLGSGWRGAAQSFSGSGFGAQDSGFAYRIANPLEDLRGVINALAEKRLINVISTPAVMVQDNHQASMQVGDQQPIRTSQTVSELGTAITSSIQYRDTGVMLEVTPSVNAGGMVTMNLRQSVTDVGPPDTATGQRTFLERNINSRVAVRSGESVVLGGLIRDRTTTSRGGVPFFQDLPVLGNLFRTTTRNQDRTELLVIITPRVLTREQDLRDVSRELRTRMRGLEAFERQLDELIPATRDAAE